MLNLLLKDTYIAKELKRLIEKLVRVSTIVSNSTAILKLLFFPVFWRCLCSFLIERKVIPTLKKHGDILAYMLLSSVIGYCVIFEAWSSPLNKSVAHYG